LHECGSGVGEVNGETINLRTLRKGEREVSSLGGGKKKEKNRESLTSEEREETAIFFRIKIGGLWRENPGGKEKRREAGSKGGRLVSLSRGARPQKTGKGNLEKVEKVLALFSQRRKRMSSEGVITLIFLDPKARQGRRRGVAKPWRPS